MTFDDGVWTLRRDNADFSELGFAQRFEATLSEDGRTLPGRWETGQQDGTWTLDFELIHRKVD